MKTLITSLAACAALAGATATPALAANAPARTETVKLLFGRNAFKAPKTSSTKVRSVPSLTPIGKLPYTLPVLERRTVKNVNWLRVRLPGRPNGSKGWIKADGTQPGSTTWAVGVNLNRRQAVVYRSGKVVRRFSVIIGKRSTPTPTGHFFVTETIAQPRPYTLGPWVLALNGYSDIYFKFAGGPGQIALHGKGLLRGANLGDAASNGCVRFADKDTYWLAKNLPVGTPVSIQRNTAKVTGSPARAKAARTHLPIVMNMDMPLFANHSALSIIAG